jgi:GTP-binding protein HflX
LEELHDADLFLHVVDATSSRIEEQIKTVESILVRLDLKQIAVLLVLNKTDLLTPEEIPPLEKKLGGIAVSALHPPSLSGLVERIGGLIWPHFSIPQT